jgi:hypothetical protein
VARIQRQSRLPLTLIRKILASDKGRFLLLLALFGLCVGVGVGVVELVGAPRELANGSWYGKIVAVDVADRSLSFSPACEIRRGIWIVVSRRARSPARVTVARDADLAIYYRPSGSLVAGHVQGADLRLLGDAAIHGRLPDFPPGWYVVVQHDLATAVSEDSGLRSAGTYDRRRAGCTWTRQTAAFVGH